MEDLNKELVTDFPLRSHTKVLTHLVNKLINIILKPVNDTESPKTNNVLKIYTAEIFFFLKKEKKGFVVY